MMLKMRCCNCRRALISLEWRLNGGAKPYSAAPEKRRKEKRTLCSLISPLGMPKVKVTPVIDRCVQGGNRVRFAELIRIVHDLRKRNRFSQALEVLEWTKRNGNFTYTPTEHALQIDLIGRVHGYVSAESYFNGLNEEDRTEKTYGALLHCYVRQTMKEKGLSLTAVAYNDIMSLYTNVGQHKKVPQVLNEMEVNGVNPDNLSYRICINSYGVRSDIDGIMAWRRSFVKWSIGMVSLLTGVPTQLRISTSKAGEKMRQMVTFN